MISCFCLKQNFRVVLEKDIPAADSPNVATNQLGALKGRQANVAAVQNERSASRHRAHSEDPRQTSSSVDHGCTLLPGRVLGAEERGSGLAPEKCHLVV